MMNKHLNIILTSTLFLSLTCCGQDTIRSQLITIVDAFAKGPSDSLQRLIFSKSEKLSIPLPTPKQYFELIKKAKTTIENSNYASAFLSAANDLESAIYISPWNREAFFNIAVVYEQIALLLRDIKYFDKSIINYQYFLLTKPELNKAEFAKDRIDQIKRTYADSEKHFEKEKKKIANDVVKINEYKDALKAGTPSWFLYKSPTWHFAWKLIGDIMYTPILVNVEQASKESRVVPYAGMGAGFGIEFWPIYSDHIGLGGEIKSCKMWGSMQTKDDALAQATPNFYYYVYSFNFYAGSRSVKALLRYSSNNMRMSKQWPGFSINVNSATPNYEIGLRLTAKHDRRNFELYVSAQDVKSLNLSPNWNKMGYGLRIIWAHTCELGLEYFNNRTVFGDQKYVMQDPYKNTGLFGKLTFLYRFDLYGRKY